MKKISRTPFNKIFYTCAILSILFCLVFYFQDLENPLIFIIIYLVAILFVVISQIGGINDIEYDTLKVRVTNVVAGKVTEIYIKDMKSAYTEFVTAMGDLVVFENKNKTKDKFMTIGCDLDEIKEMIEFINDKIKEMNNESKSK
ncbi:MAG: hypothetical protein ACQETL_16380 [Bacteroidota bacterium]